MTLQQDILADPRRLEREAGIEFVNGQIVEKPVSMESSRIAMCIAFLLSAHLQKVGGADVFDSTLGYQCFPKEPSRFRKPDVSVIKRERLAGLPPDPGMMPIPADLTVEVLSPGDLAYEVEERIEDYLSNGFDLLWIVHPQTNTVTIHRADGSIDKLYEDDDITGENVLPGFTCKVAEFFAHTGPERSAQPNLQ